MAKTQEKSEVVEGQIPQAVLDQMEREGWTRHSQEIEAWETGREVRGLYVDLREGNLTNADGTKAKLLTLSIDGKERVFGAPTTLVSKLARVQPGRQVYIICLGKYRTKSGQMAWGFELFSK